jgi:hypothetical protein
MPLEQANELIARHGKIGVDQCFADTMRPETHDAHA